MQDLLYIVLFVAGWVLFTKYLLPKLGVQT
jgi:hypothetical protein